MVDHDTKLLETLKQEMRKLAKESAVVSEYNYMFFGTFVLAFMYYVSMFSRVVV